MVKKKARKQKRISKPKKHNSRPKAHNSAPKSHNSKPSIVPKGLSSEGVSWVKKAISKGFERSQVVELLKNIDQIQAGKMISYYDKLKSQKEKSEKAGKDIISSPKRIGKAKTGKKSEKKSGRPPAKEKLKPIIGTPSSAQLTDLKKRLEQLEKIEAERQKREEEEKKRAEEELKATGELLEEPKEAKLGKSLKARKGKMSTGIANLDKITGGGLETGSTNLLIGGSGNGKSIFAIQFLIEGVKKGEKVLYITFEERKEEFYDNMLGLGWNLKKMEQSGKFSFLSYTPEKVKTMLEEGGGEIESRVLRGKINRVAIDSITAFIMLYSNDVERREASLALFKLLRGWDCTSLLTYERDPLVDKRSSSRVLEFESDAIILLYFLRLKKKRERFLEVYKMRGAEHSTDIYPYTISRGGIKLSNSPFSGNLDRFREV